MEDTHFLELTITITSTAAIVHMGAYHTSETLEAQREHAISRVSTPDNLEQRIET